MERLKEEVSSLNALGKKIQALYEEVNLIIRAPGHKEIRARALRIKRLAQGIATAARRLELKEKS